MAENGWVPVFAGVVLWREGIEGVVRWGHLVPVWNVFR